MKVIDMHCDTVSALLEQKKSGASVSLRENGLMIDLRRMRESGYSVQNFALFVEKQEGESSFEKAMELLVVFREQMALHSDWIAQVMTAEEILENERNGKLSALLTVEEGDVCEGKLENLHVLYEQGVRMMTLTWNYPNAIGYPNLNVKQYDPYTPNTADGLTERGVAFVEEMERMGMIVDVSHLSDAGFYDVLAHTKKPFVASHSNARAVCPNVRNLTDDMIRKLAERGGVTGLNFCMDFLRDPSENGGASYAALSDIAAHARHIAKVGGVECVGLGSDFDGIPINPAIPGAESIPCLADAFGRAGFHESEIDRILYGNVFRLYREILG